MKKVLITYFTKCSTCAEISGVLEEKLETMGARVEIRPLDEALNIAPFNIVIIGSPLYAGRIPQKVKNYVNKNRHVLSTITAAFYFTSSKPLDNDAHDSDLDILVDSAFDITSGQVNRFGFLQPSWSLSDYVKKTLKIVKIAKPSHIAFFKAKHDFDQLSKLQKSAEKLKKRILREVEVKTRLNTEDVQKWADRLW